MNVESVLEFDWDNGNKEKNIKHNVSDAEAEQVFFDKNKVINEDVRHSQKEKRYIVIGKTKEGRLLYTVYTMRKKYIRIVSSRDTNKKEKTFYEKDA